jgi:hypothetical protein
VSKLRTRRPTGKPGWPRVLVTGAEGCWKSGTAALLSADERIGRMFWLEVGDGETTADEYGALPGVDYEILDHDGTWLDIYNQVSAAWDVAKAAEEAGEPPGRRPHRGRRARVAARWPGPPTTRRRSPPTCGG